MKSAPPRNPAHDCGMENSPKRVAHNAIGQEAGIQRLREANADRYDYTRAVYSGAQGQLIVTCRVHGHFKISAAGHLRGQGCRECRAIEETSARVARFRRIHGDRFDYSRVQGGGRLVEIVCRLHGSFHQRPDAHRASEHPCPTCRAEAATLDSKDWIARFTERHGNRFDYSTVDYRGSGHEITILCPVHGAISMRPDAHLISDSGCRQCGNFSRRLTLDEVLSRFKAMHAAGQYTYERLGFTTTKDKVTVTCSAHGDFVIGANSHLNGNGCKKCTGSGTSFPESTWMDAIEVALGVPVQRGLKIDGLLRTTVDGLVQTRSGIFVVVEYDGQYWHSRNGAFDRDTRKTAALLRLGYPVVRLRADNGFQPPLGDVPGATNIVVPDFPNPDSVERVQALIEAQKSLDRSVSTAGLTFGDNGRTRSI